MAVKLLTGVDLANQKAINVADPSAGTDGANKQYVDNTARNLNWKDNVQAASTANVTLATPGTTMDGVTLAAGRVLLKNQTTPAENGIYVWSGAASALVRADDANANGELRGGTAVSVVAGTVNGDKVFQITSPDGNVTIGTDAQTWGQLGGGGATYTGSAGVKLVSNDFQLDIADTNPGLVIRDGGAAVDFTTVARRMAANVGNGSLTTIDITHGFGHKDVQVEVVDASTGETVYPDVTRPDNNTARLVFAVAPTTNQYRCIVVG